MDEEQERVEYWQIVDSINDHIVSSGRDRDDVLDELGGDVE